MSDYVARRRANRSTPTMHYEDLTLCSYHPDQADSNSWQAPLLSIGWLEKPYPFPIGKTPPDVLPKLKDFVSRAHSYYSHLCFRGGYDCSFCETQQSALQPGPIWSQEILIIPGEKVVYAAPGGIVHYIESHSYLPPTDFVAAVIRCPLYGSPEFQESLRFANAGATPPMVTTAEDKIIWDQKFAETLRRRRTT